MKNAGHKVQLADKGDFLIGGKQYVEVGGKDKSYKQIADLDHAYIAADEIEIGFDHDHLEAKLGLSNGAIIIKADTKNGPDHFHLFFHNWFSGDKQKHDCNELKLKK